MRRFVGIALVIVTALVLQSTVFSELRLFGVRPELMFLVTILLALLGGPSEGAIVGFVSGMAQDFMLNQPKGITALTLTLLGYGVGMTRQYIVSPSPLVPTAVVFVGTLAGTVFYVVVAYLLGAYERHGRVRGPGRAPRRRVQRGAHPHRVPAAAARDRRPSFATGGAGLMERASSRLRMLALLVALMFIGLTARLWFLQVLATERFSSAATENSIRFEYSDPTRGVIYDRNGNPLVENQPSHEVRITRDQLGEDGEAVVLRLAELMDVDPAVIAEQVNSNRYYPFQAVPVAEFVDEEVAIYIREHPEEFPGVDVKEASVRRYPNGRLAAHLFGYMGLITEELLGQVNEKQYGPNDSVGVAGLELQYEKFLRGERGIRKFIVNADGETIRPLDEIPSTHGDDLHLTLDTRWQQVAEEELAQGIELARGDTDSTNVNSLKANAGAVVVLDAEDRRDPRDGVVPQLRPALVRARSDAQTVPVPDGDRRRRPRSTTPRSRTRRDRPSRRSRR